MRSGPRQSEGIRCSSSRRYQLKVEWALALRYAVTTTALPHTGSRSDISNSRSGITTPFVQVLLPRPWTRSAAITHARTGAEKLWAGRMVVQPDAKTGPHHHGELETVLYVVKGRVRMRWGDHLELSEEARAGDFIYATLCKRAAHHLFFRPRIDRPARTVRQTRPAMDGNAQPSDLGDATSVELFHNSAGRSGAAPFQVKHSREDWRQRTFTMSASAAAKIICPTTAA